MQAPFAPVVILFITLRLNSYTRIKKHTHTAHLHLNTTIYTHQSITTHTTGNTYNMARGEATKIKVHFKGTHDDFIVFVDDAEVYDQWRTDKSIPLAHFISTFKVFATGQ